MQKRGDIQALRGIAVLAICGFHLGIFQRTGFLGVDLFFVVSGFVVTPLIIDSISDPLLRIKGIANFWRKRFFRLAPALSVMLVASCLLLIVTTQTYNHQRFFLQAIASLVGIGNLGAYRWSGNYFQPEPNAFVHTWSLSIEEQVYVLLPIILFLFRRRFRSITVLIITVMSFVLWVDPGMTNRLWDLLGIDYGSSLGLDFYSPLHRFWEFGIGSLASLFKPFPIHKWILAGIHLVIFGILVFPFYFIQVEILTVTLLGMTLLVLCNSETNEINWVSSTLTFVGDRSYSIYLAHMPIIVSSLHLTLAYSINSNFSFIMQIICISLATHYLYKVENRFRIAPDRDTRMSMKRGVVAFIIAPLLIMSSFLYLEENRYFGLDRSPPSLPAAWSQDPNCDRNNSQVPCKYLSGKSIGELLLIGDSTSGALSELAIKIGKVKNLDVLIWSRGGCAFNLENRISKPEESCETHNEEVLAYIKSK